MATKTIQESIAALQQTKDDIESALSSAGGSIPYPFKLSNVPGIIRNLPNSSGLFNLPAGVKISTSSAVSVSSSSALLWGNSVLIDFLGGSAISPVPLEVTYKKNGSSTVVSTTLTEATAISTSLGVRGFRLKFSTPSPLLASVTIKIRDTRGTTLLSHTIPVKKEVEYEVAVTDNSNNIYKEFRIVSMEPDNA